MLLRANKIFAANPVIEVKTHAMVLIFDFIKKHMQQIFDDICKEQIRLHNEAQIGGLLTIKLANKLKKKTQIHWDICHNMLVLHSGGCYAMKTILCCIFQTLDVITILNRTEP